VAKEDHLTKGVAAATPRAYGLSCLRQNAIAGVPSSALNPPNGITPAPLLVNRKS
jgi:hypothetical protein